MRTRLSVLLLLATLTTGCGPLAGVQSHLVDEAREGLRRVETARKSDSDAVRQWLAERRARLDAAFDADIRARKPDDLTPAWIIDARHGYALGIDHLATARAAQDRADTEAADNAAAADEALALLQRSLKAQENFLNLNPLTLLQEAK